MKKKKKYIQSEHPTAGHPQPLQWVAHTFGGGQKGLASHTILFYFEKKIYILCFFFIKKIILIRHIKHVLVVDCLT
jgi:hypothetical protein